MIASFVFDLTPSHSILFIIFGEIRHETQADHIANPDNSRLQFKQQRHEENSFSTSQYG